MEGRAGGLSVEAVLDPGVYPTGVKISDKLINTVSLTPERFHGEWNYVIHSQQAPEVLQTKASHTKSTK